MKNYKMRDVEVKRETVREWLIKLNNALDKFYYSRIFFLITLIIGLTLTIGIALGLMKPSTPLDLPRSLLIAAVSLFTLLTWRRLGKNVIVLSWFVTGLALSRINVEGNPYCTVAFMIVITAMFTYVGIMKKRGWV